MKTIIVVLCLPFISASVSNANAQSRWSDNDYQFSYPDNLTVTRSPDPDCYHLALKRDPKNHPYDLEICKYQKGFWEILKQTDFSFEEEKW